MNTFVLTLGLMEPAISEQMEGMLPEPELKNFDADALAISRLCVRGCLTNTEATKARKRLTKKVQDAVNKQEEKR